MIVNQWLTGALAILEHPELPEEKNGTQPPSIWILPIFLFLKKLAGIHILHIKQGFWGARSPKPTALLMVARGVSTDFLYQVMYQACTTTTLPRALPMGRVQKGYATASLKRYPPGLCDALSRVFMAMLPYVDFTPAEKDEHFEIFERFHRAYLHSKEEDDGADYVPQNQKN